MVYHSSHNCKKPYNLKFSLLMNFEPIYELYVKPTYAVLLPQREPRKHGYSIAQIKNRDNLKKNQHAGKLSDKASKRLATSINWLVASAKKKYIFDKKSGKRFNFLINFVTLTLPTTDHDITDNFFKKVLLHNFINACRYKFDLKNFVWKVESQENGNIHAHFTTDTFMHWEELRKVWNKILSKHGIIQKYHDKHKDLSFEDYAEMYSNGGKTDMITLLNRFTAGKKDNWSNPNTTDVHAVHKVRDVAAYLASYMTKKEEDKREIKGRLWGCSQNLSESNKLTIEIAGSEQMYILNDLFSPEIKYKPIEIQGALSSEKFKIGEIFFYKMQDWGTKLKGFLLERYNEHRFNIRNAIDLDVLKSYAYVPIPPNPKRIEIDCPF